jgi:hypothetical protein
MYALHVAPFGAEQGKCWEPFYFTHGFQILVNFVLTKKSGQPVAMC